MEIDYIDTNIGKFNIAIPSKDFICRELPKYRNDSGSGEIIIKSCLTRVIFVLKDGTRFAIEPVTMESCMKPGEKNIIPITYRAMCGVDGNVTEYEVSTPYQRVGVVDLCQENSSMSGASYAKWGSHDVTKEIYRHCEDMAGSNYRHCEDMAGSNYRYREDIAENNYRHREDIAGNNYRYNMEDIADVYTEDYIPHIKVNSCAVCRNCGRC